MVSTLGARHRHVPVCLDAKGCFARSNRRKYCWVVRKHMRTWLISLIALACFVSGCGGASSTPPPPQPISVSVSPTSQGVLLGAMQQFTATVTGTTNTSVTWAVNGATRGSATVGTISSSGLYTAPKDLPSPAGVKVTATSAADTSKTADASVTVTSD